MRVESASSMTGIIVVSGDEASSTCTRRRRDDSSRRGVGDNREPPGNGGVGALDPIDGPCGFAGRRRMTEAVCTRL